MNPAALRAGEILADARMAASQAAIDLDIARHRAATFQTRYLGLCEAQGRDPGSIDPSLDRIFRHRIGFDPPTPERLADLEERHIAALEVVQKAEAAHVDALGAKPPEPATSTYVARKPVTVCGFRYMTGEGIPDEVMAELDYAKVDKLLGAKVIATRLRSPELELPASRS